MTCPSCGAVVKRFETCLACEAKLPPRWPERAALPAEGRLADERRERREWWAERIRESEERKRRAREAVEAGDRDLARRILEKRA